jgi:hypothetical protein
MYSLRRITSKKDLLTLAKDARVIMMSDDVMFAIVNIKGPKSVDNKNGFRNRLIDISEDGCAVQCRDFDLKQFVFKKDMAIISYTLHGTELTVMKAFEAYEIVKKTDS